MKIYTKTGDAGATSLFGGSRVAKHHPRLEAYGTLDELNAWLGLLRDQPMDERYYAQLVEIQESLFTIGAFLAMDPKKSRLKNGKDRLGIRPIRTADVESLECEIDAMDAQLPKMSHFILPGGHPTVSYCHIARTVCRRAERLMVQLHDSEPLDPLLLAYVNRLSDYLFVLARKLSQDLHVNELSWAPKTKG